MNLADERAYYTAALQALRYIDVREKVGRRFGSEADARWSAFRGELTVSDRIDLLVRDADAQWPGALGARVVFARRAVSEDESFGADWAPLDPVDAEALWRELHGGAAPETVRAALTAAARAWGIELRPVEVGPIDPAEHLVLVGPSAIAATVEAFSTGRDLDWSAQVTVIATPPAHRQLAALGAALLSATKPTRLTAATEPRQLRGTARRIASPDASPVDASAT